MGAASKRSVEVGDLVEGRYRILKVLGEGGMGTVFLAEHTLIKRRVAIKILHPQFASDAHVVERFMNEARAAGTLGHPNIVESTDMGFTHDNVPYIVFEYLEGALLTDEIYRLGGLPMRRAVRIAEQIANALRAAHDAGIIHRDLKSDNVFLTDKDDEFDRVKVLDFGISRFLETEEAQRGMVMGTPEFMAPEQITHPDAIDRRADIYALGVILYEMLTARRPFTGGKDVTELQRKIVQDPPPPLERDVPHGLNDLIVHKMLAKDPAHRPQSMGAVQVALEAFLTRSDGTPLPRRRSGAISAQPEDFARNSESIPRPQGMLLTPYPTNTPGTLPPPVGMAERKRPIALYAVAGISLVVGGAGLAIGLQHGSRNAAPAVATAPQPAPAASLPAPAPAPAPREEQKKIDVTIDSDVAGARVVFRRRISVAPFEIDINPNDVVELLEVSAPGYKTERYWLTFDRPTHLKAHLVRGNGIEEASEEQTLVALGEATAPAQPAAVAPKAETHVASASESAEEGSAPMARRRIGHAAAVDAPPGTTVAVEAISRPRTRVSEGAIAMASTAAMPEPVAPPAPVAAVPVPAAPTPVAQPAVAQPAVAQPAPRAAVAARVIAPSAFKALLASSSQISAPEVVQAQMMRDEKKKTTAVLKVCTSASGEVTAATIVRSSGYTAYDEALVSGVRGWRYRPYVQGGQAVPVCSAVVVAFAIQ